MIPNLNKEDKRIPISSVVLSSQRVDMKDALFNAAKDKDKGADQQSVDPLVQDGQKLIPSVTRVFSRSQRYVRLSAGLRASADTTHPLVAFVTFYRGPDQGVRDAAARSDRRPESDSLKTVPLRFSFPLRKLPPGEYDCQVTVLDPTGQKAAFWQGR